MRRKTPHPPSHLGEVHAGRPGSRHRAAALLTALAVVASGLGVSAAPAQAASVTGASFTAGGVVRDGVRYAKTGDQLTLSVNTDNDTKCVGITGAHAAEQASSTTKAAWTFPLVAGTGNGLKTITATAYKNSNANGKCTGNAGEVLGSNTASYTVDNDSTGPVVTATLSPLPNPQGWNNSDVTIRWTANDDAGVASITPETDAVTANSPVGGVERTTVAKDHLGNATTGRVTVKLDKDGPVVAGTRTPAPNDAGWNNTDVTVSFTTTDSLSGADIAAVGKVVGEGADQAVSGIGTDVAGNITSATVGAINVDKTAPTLTGAATTEPNGSGWYAGDVSIAWTAGDRLSGLAGQVPTNSTIAGEGPGLTATETVSDKAGNTTTASSTAVNIDRTAPTTKATAPNGWNTTDQTVVLVPSDVGSGVASTSHTVDDGAVQTGTSVAITTDGEHTLTYWSVDQAGNAEQATTVIVKVDKTAPSISSAQSPIANGNGWNNSNVTVSFVCDDAGSGIASCSADEVITTEGRARQATGRATDNAGNTMTATHTVNLDKTAPTITAAADREANALGWYDDDVTVSFLALDALSGIASAPPAQTLGEGPDQGATGTAVDAAGNSASASVTGLNVDKTAPRLSGTASATGWSRGDVTVQWTASDALSGLAGDVPAASVVVGEGADLFAGASVTDRAGHTTAKTVTGIKIDRTAPHTSATVEAPGSSGWYGKDVEVTLSGTDNLSGVAQTYYRVGDGAVREYTDAFSHGVKGVSTIAYWSIDVAGNTEGERSLELKIDGTAPTTAIDLPQSFSTGWYADNVPVAFNTTDTESGVAKTFYKVDEGAAQEWDGVFDHTLDGTHTISFWSVDVVGNVEEAKSYELKVDTSDPTITGSRTPAANVFGWNNTDVTVSFICADSQSGVKLENCTPPVPVTNEGADQSVNGTATDNVGKTASTTVGDIDIDKTAPTLTAVRQTPANAAGWNNADVVISWTGADALSGIDPARQPADSTITGEGADLGASASIKDKAGNTGSGSITGIKIDRTKPVVSGAIVNEDGTARTANAAGWFNSAVRVRYNAIDVLSGVQEKPGDTVLAADGANQSATGSATDLADNTASTTVTGINVDSKAPQTSANNVCDGKNGWCKGQTATVNLTAADQAGLSGVKEIHYAVNGAAEKTAAGASASVTVPLAAKSGLATVEFYAVDNAGNVEAKGGVSLKYDNIAPTVTHSVNPAANAAGWNSADTTVHFDAKDDDGGSGVDTATVTPDVTVTAETAASGQLVSGSASDLAGNVGTDSVTVKLDKTAPGIIAAVKLGTKGANGFYTGPVTVGFTCSDGLSTIATCPADVVLNADGVDQSATGTAVDKAGNEASTTLGGLDIDSTTPLITVSDVKASYGLGEATGISCTATDATSGVDANGCQVTITGGTANGVGTFSYTATATDNAGNLQTSSGTYRVLYTWNGFLQPINDTAHQVDQGVSIFKAGSTVPVKFQLRNATGEVVQATSAAWTTPSAGAATAATVSEEAYALTATTGGVYKYDATAQQYLYNWSTKGLKAGLYYRIGVKLDDGQTYTVSIGLR